MGAAEGTTAYKRILLKISGEALQGPGGYGIDLVATRTVANEIKDLHALGIEAAIVLGGGNIFRGEAATSGGGLDRVSADYMGMLATVVNGLALQNVLEQVGVQTRVQSAIEIQRVAEPYIRRRAIRHLEKGRVVIFVAGTGNPYFTTDTAAALRAIEIGAQVVLKGTKVDGVYSADPIKDPQATKYRHVSYLDVVNRGLKVMDATAVTLCMDNQIPIIVFNLFTPGNMRRVLMGEPVGTYVGGAPA